MVDIKDNDDIVNINISTIKRSQKVIMNVRTYLSNNGINLPLHIEQELVDVFHMLEKSIDIKIKVNK